MHTLFSALMAIFLPCTGMVAVFIVYLCAFCYVARHNNNHSPHTPPPPKASGKGLAVEDLNKLPRVFGKDLMVGTDCPVCLDEIKDDEAVRLVPGCNHGFHLECGDTWLSKQSACPVCRAVIQPELFRPTEDNP